MLRDECTSCDARSTPAHVQLTVVWGRLRCTAGILRFYGWLDQREPLNHTVPPPAHLANTSGWRSEWLGVALDHAPADNDTGDTSATGPRGDGTLRHRRYFDCPDKHAVFLPMCADKVGGVPVCWNRVPPPSMCCNTGVIGTPR